MTEEQEALRAAVEGRARQFLKARQAGLAVPGLHALIVAEVERALISAVMAATGGNQMLAAAIVGLNRNTLRKKIRESVCDSS